MLLSSSSSVPEILEHFQWFFRNHLYGVRCLRFWEYAAQFRKNIIRTNMNLRHCWEDQHCASSEHAGMWFTSGFWFSVNSCNTLEERSISRSVLGSVIVCLSANNPHHTPRWDRFLPEVVEPPTLQLNTSNFLNKQVYKIYEKYATTSAYSKSPTGVFQTNI